MSESQEDSYQDAGDSYNSSDTGSIDGYADEVLSQQQDDSLGDSQKQDTEYLQTGGDTFRVLEDKRILEKLKEEDQLVPVPKDQRSTLDCISKYEYASVIGKRARQIASNAPLYINVPLEQLKGLSAIEIAEMEYKQKKIPFIIRRVLPNRQYEDWALQQLENKNI